MYVNAECEKIHKHNSSDNLYAIDSVGFINDP